MRFIFKSVCVSSSPSLLVGVCTGVGEGEEGEDARYQK